jgi:hypothetical protein
MLSSLLGVLPILTPPLCALALSCAQSPIPLLCLPLIYVIGFFEMGSCRLFAGTGSKL